MIKDVRYLHTKNPTFYTMPDAFYGITNLFKVMSSSASRFTKECELDSDVRQRRHLEMEFICDILITIARALDKTSCTVQEFRTFFEDCFVEISRYFFLFILRDIEKVYHKYILIKLYTLMNFLGFEDTSQGEKLMSVYDRLLISDSRFAAMVEYYCP